VCRGHAYGGHHDARLSGGRRLGQATPLRFVRFAADGLDRTAAPPGARKYVMASMQPAVRAALARCGVNGVLVRLVSIEVLQGGIVCHRCPVERVPR
jgi:hypothetical protein